MHRPLVIAHRGASAYSVENSREAFHRAVASHADGIELDVHATADGTLVVHHDAELPALGPIAELTYPNVLRHRLANGETIPTLEEVLPLASRIHLWVELKGLPAAHDRSILQLWDSCLPAARFSIHSFDHRIVRRLVDQRPAMEGGILLGARLLETPDAARRAGARTVWQEGSHVDAELVAQLAAQDLSCVAWTVDDPDAQRRLAIMGVAAICTNRPAETVALLDHS